MASATANVHITVTGSGTPEPEVRGTENRDMLQARVNELEERCAFQTEHIQMLRTRVKDLEEARCPAHDGQAASTTQASASAQTGQASGATGDDDRNVGGPAAAVGGGSRPHRARGTSVVGCFNWRHTSHSCSHQTVLPRSDAYYASGFILFVPPALSFRC